MATATKKHGEHKHHDKNLGRINRLHNAVVEVDGGTSTPFKWYLALYKPTPHGKICTGDCLWQTYGGSGRQDLHGLFCYDPEAMKLKVWVPNARAWELNITLLHFNL